MKLNSKYLVIALVFSPGIYAAEIAEAMLPEVEVVGKMIEPLPTLSDSALREQDLTQFRTNSSDTARLLGSMPGISVHSAGGVSGMPVIHGMADDRIRIQVDGMNLISACANHMNTPLSYIDPANVDSVMALVGITPVELGGDSIGGTIRVDSAAPEFAKPGEGTLRKARAGAFYRSNNAATGANLSATIASEAVSARYTGSTVSAKNYTAGADFKPAGLAATDRGWLDGDEVGSSKYKSENHMLGLAYRQGNHLVDLKLGIQDIPYQGFPNQRMDMTGNDSDQVNLRYKGLYQWGNLEARVYREHTRHQMNFGDDKQFLYMTAPGMPMDTEGRNTGAVLTGEFFTAKGDIWKLGAEYQQFKLDDWWSPSGTGGMMSPDTFWNINNGQRYRQDIFAQWEATWTQGWMSQVGLRSGSVRMDTGAVQGYSPAYDPAANAFNALNHQRTDNNLDITMLARYTPDSRKYFEAGYAQKTRSPNLYERFVWSNTNTMVMNMNNWFGDGNGYVGNLNLRPEVAHTLSVSGVWHDEAEQNWEFKVSPYYTRVDGYIDAVACSAIGLTCPTRTDGFVNLTLDNQSARLYGADLSGKLSLVEGQDYGTIGLVGMLNYVRGKNLTASDNLYSVMPLNMTLAIEQKVAKWTNTIAVKLVDAKTDVQAVRKELPTGGYGLLDVRTSYEVKQVRVDVGVENLLNKFYIDPLGGAYLGQGATMGTGVPYGTLVPGMGRSINSSVTVTF